MDRDGSTAAAEFRTCRAVLRSDEEVEGLQAER